jgi:hypothetical protein
MESVLLGGKSFTITPLTFLQLQTVLPAFRISRGSLATEESFNAMADILMTALGITRQELDGMPTNQPEIISAVTAIAKLAGLIETGEAAAGKTL